MAEHSRGSKVARRRQASVAAAAVVAALASVGQAMAAVVLAVSMSDMLRDAELVFEGQVTGIETRKEPGDHSPRTYVTFQVSEIIKGESSLESVELAFLGGTADGMTLQVTDMSVPELGERGIYFVESLKRKQVHPLYGWSQGHFVVIQDKAGVHRVMTADGQPVIAVDTPEKVSAHQRLSTGSARGLALGGQAQVDQAMSSTGFKRALTSMLGSR